MMEVERRAPTGWHLDKKVPLALIGVLLAYGFAGYGLIADMRKDIELMKAQIVMQRETDARQDLTSRERVLEVRDALIDLRRSVEKLADKVVGGK
jgi:hypothetical protein